jgi:orotidine-5'-phosphate decarboxylase
MSGRHFADALLEDCHRKQSQIVVGLDPRLDRLPAELRPGGSASGQAECLLAFNKALIEAVAEYAAAVKCQIAFYEQLGCAGMSAYAATIRHAEERDLIVIADAKRSDIASTASAYAAAHLGGHEGGADDFVADAVTVNPYLGSDGVRPFVNAAAATGRGVFVLVKTSNPSSVELQDLDCGGAPLYEHVAALVAAWGGPHRGTEGYSSVGAVVGATFPEELARLRALMPHTPLLVPGFGAQGGGVRDVVAAFDAQGDGAIINSSRSIIFAWRRAPYAERFGEKAWRDAVRAAAADMRAQLWQATH